MFGFLKQKNNDEKIVYFRQIWITKSLEEKCEIICSLIGSEMKSLIQIYNKKNVDQEFQDHFTVQGYKENSQYFGSIYACVQIAKLTGEDAKLSQVFDVFIRNHSLMAATIFESIYYEIFAYPGIHKEYFKQFIELEAKISA